jgi:hypothetical protein
VPETGARSSFSVEFRHQRIVTRSNVVPNGSERSRIRPRIPERCGERHDGDGGVTGRDDCRLQRFVERPARARPSDPGVVRFVQCVAEGNLLIVEDVIVRQADVVGARGVERGSRPLGVHSTVKGPVGPGPRLTAVGQATPQIDEQPAYPLEIVEHVTPH